MTALANGQTQRGLVLDQTPRSLTAECSGLAFALVLSELCRERDRRFAARKMKFRQEGHEEREEHEEE